MRSLAEVHYNENEERWEGYIGDKMYAHTTDSSRESCAFLINEFERKGYEVDLIRTGD